MRNDRLVQFFTTEESVTLDDYFKSLCLMLDSVKECAESEITTDVA